MNNYLTSVIFLIFIGIIFFTYQNGHINKSVFVLSLFLFAIIIPLFYYGTKKQVENFRHFSSLDQLSNASLDAYYVNTTSEDYDNNMCDRKKSKGYDPLVGVYQDFPLIGDKIPQFQLLNNTGVQIYLTDFSIDDATTSGEAKLSMNIRVNKNGTKKNEEYKTTISYPPALPNYLFMIILSNIELTNLQDKIENTDANIDGIIKKFVDELGNLTFKFGGTDGLPTNSIKSYIDSDWNNAGSTAEDQLILNKDYLVFGGNLGLLNGSGITPPTDNTQTTAVYKVNMPEGHAMTYDLEPKVDDYYMLKASRTGFLRLNNKNYPRVYYKDPTTLRNDSPFLFREWCLIENNNKYLSFSSNNNESNVFLTPKNTFSKQLYAQSPKKGTNRSKVYLNDKLPQQWQIGLFSNVQSSKILCFIYTFPNREYYLGVTGDKVTCSPFTKQTKQLWKLTRYGNKFTIQSAFNGSFLASTNGDGYLYGNRGNVYLMKGIDEANAPKWDISFSLAGQTSNENDEPNNPSEMIEGFSNMGQINMVPARDTPISSGEKGPWDKLYKQYWNGDYIYCFTYKGLDKNTKINYLTINLDDNGKGIVNINPENMRLPDGDVEISYEDSQRYGGSYEMKAISSNLIFGKKTDGSDVGLYLEMLPTTINKQTLIQQMLLQPNKIKIKALIIDGNKKISLCGPTWNERDRIASYCVKKIYTIEPFTNEYVPTATQHAVLAQATGGSDGNLPIGEDDSNRQQGYPTIHSGPLSVGEWPYTDPKLAPCKVGSGKKIAIPGWFQDSGDKRLGQTEGTCVSINPSFSAIGREDGSAVSTSKESTSGTKGMCSGTKYLSGAIRNSDVSYLNIPGRTQQFGGKDYNQLIKWKGACLPSIQVAPGVYRAFNKSNKTPVGGYGYWLEGNQMVSTYMIPQYDGNRPPLYIDQSGRRRNADEYVNSPQHVAVLKIDIRPTREPWRNFWNWNENANVVCQEVEEAKKSEAFAQSFESDGSIKYYKFLQIPEAKYNSAQNLDACKRQFDNSSSKVVCKRVTDLDPVFSPKRNFWRTTELNQVIICEAPQYKADNWSETGYAQPTSPFARTYFGEVNFVRLATGNEKYNLRLAQRNNTFIVPYYFRQGGKDNNYFYPDLPKRNVVIRGFYNEVNGMYIKTNQNHYGKPIWVKEGQSVNNGIIIRWEGNRWIITKRTWFGYITYGYIPTENWNNYFYTATNRDKDLENVLPVGAPIFSYYSKEIYPFPNGPKLYPSNPNQYNNNNERGGEIPNLKPCKKHGIELPGWYEDPRFGQQDQCIAWPRYKYPNKCCNTTYNQGSKRGQNVTYNGQDACNVNFNRNSYPNGESIYNWKNHCQPNWWWYN